MPWYLSNAMFGVAIGVLGLAVTALLVARDRFDRGRVEVDAARSGIVWDGSSGRPHGVVLALLRTGNRATVVRDIRLVSAEGESYVVYRDSPHRAQPPPPFRLGAPEERIATLELTEEEEERLDRVEVDLLDETEPVAWRYVRSPGLVAREARPEQPVAPVPRQTRGARSAGGADAAVEAPGKGPRVRRAATAEVVPIAEPFPAEAEPAPEGVEGAVEDQASAGVAPVAEPPQPEAEQASDDVEAVDVPRRKAQP
ncbi:MAG TPA: hypothetical protein VFR85_13085 [Anaeromyxobacteraceae bacterium]|nr:hypothetical protein [Anaeromyxobacteraceae bacterium]